MKIIPRSCLSTLAMLATLGAQAQQVDLKVATGSPVLLAGEKQTAFLKVALTGFELNDTRNRTPVNVAIVLDKSGSMQGEKIARAREAASMALSRLSANDIAAVVSYDSVVRVDVPATKVTDKDGFHHRIQRIQAGGNTALFAGVSKGAYEVQKFRDRDRVNRVILLSDGLANVGPSSPADLASLGASLGKEGISVTTIGLGLGYNEDLMTRLAGMSDGNHAFAESSTDLARIFSAEFGDVLSVVAQEVRIQIRCADGVRPVRVLGRDADIYGQTVHVSLNQLYGSQEKFVVLEAEVPAGHVDQSLQLAQVEVAYYNTLTGRSDRLLDSIDVRFSASQDKVTEATDKNVMRDTVTQVANQMSKDAVELRDQGQVQEAQRKLKESAAYLKQNAQQLRSSQLEALSEEFEQDAAALGDESAWNRTRKLLKKKQHSVDTQQTY